jgi:hypothetical protein
MDFWLVVNGISFVFGLLKEVLGGGEGESWGGLCFHAKHPSSLNDFFNFINFLPTLAPCYMLEL